jgi:hypothetical protein
MINAELARPRCAQEFGRGQNAASLTNDVCDFVRLVAAGDPRTLPAGKLAARIRDFRDLLRSCSPPKTQRGFDTLWA